jgi:hypothetical protein
MNSVIYFGEHHNTKICWTKLKDFILNFFVVKELFVAYFKLL